MDDSISRQAAIDALEKSGYCYDQFLGVESVLSALPSAQPEIIRCKDCEYYELTEWAAHRCDLVGRSVYGNDYCCWAERKGEQP